MNLRLSSIDSFIYTILTYLFDSKKSLEIRFCNRKKYFPDRIGLISAKVSYKLIKKSKCLK